MIVYDENPRSVLIVVGNVHRLPLRVSNEWPAYVQGIYAAG